MDFIIVQNGTLWKGKRILLIITSDNKVTVPPSLPSTIPLYVFLAYIINSFQCHRQNALVWRISCTVTLLIGLVNGELVPYPSRFAIRTPEYELLWKNGYEGSQANTYAWPSKIDWLKEGREKLHFYFVFLFCFCLRVWH